MCVIALFNYLFRKLIMSSRENRRDEIYESMLSFVCPEFIKRIKRGHEYLIRGKSKSHALRCCDSGRQSRWYAIDLTTNIYIQSDPEFNQTLTGEDLIYRRLPREREIYHPHPLCLFLSLSLFSHSAYISFSSPSLCVSGK